MVSFTTAKFPEPKSWDGFENIVSDIIQIAWKDPFSIRNGRPGQGQDGVDIYGKPYYLNGNYSGVQCKNTEKISKKEIEKEIKKAEDFKPPIKEYIIVTTSKRDSSIQEVVRLIDKERVNEGKFSVRILFWEDVCLKLAESEELMIKHFPQFIEKSTSLESIRKKIMESSIGDWEVSEDLRIYVYKKDTDLTIRKESFEESRSFKEPWLENFPDSHGHTDQHKIFYKNTPIKDLFMVEVDGGRCSIPYPHPIDHTINKYDYKLGKIINDLIYGRSRPPFDFDGYLNKAKIKVIEH